MPSFSRYHASTPACPPFHQCRQIRVIANWFPSLSEVCRPLAFSEWTSLLHSHTVSLVCGKVISRINSGLPSFRRCR